MRCDRGYALAALLVAMSVMSVALGAILPTWTTFSRREKEAELVFRGEQYARAIARFQQRYANQLPPDFDVLVREKFLRKKYKDPITGEDFVPIAPGSPLASGGADARLPGRVGTPGMPTAGQAAQMAQEMAAATRRLNELARQTGGLPAGSGVGIVGVTSRSSETSLRHYNGRDKYNEWAFLATQMASAIGAPAQGGRGRGGRDGGARDGGPPTSPGVQRPGEGSFRGGSPFGGAPFGGGGGRGGFPQPQDPNRGGRR